MINRTKWLVTWMAAGLLAPTALMAAPSAACQANGTAAFEAWSHAQYDKVGAHLAPDAAAQLPPAKLKQIWGNIQASVGAFQSLGKFEPRTIQGREAMVAPMEYKNASLVAFFTCDASNRLNSFSVLDPSRLPELKSLAK